MGPVFLALQFTKRREFFQGEYKEEAQSWQPRELSALREETIRNPAEGSTELPETPSIVFHGRKVIKTKAVLKATREEIGQQGCSSPRLGTTAVSLTSTPGQVTEQILLEDISKHRDDREVMRESQHGFTKGKLCLTKLVAFHNGVTAVANKGIATDTICLDCCKAFHMVPPTFLPLLWRDINLMDGLQMDKELAGWPHTAKELQSRAQCASTEPVTGGVPQGTVLGPTLLHVSIKTQTPSWVVQSIRGKDKVASRGTWTAWRSGAM